jgi:DNA-directed RNA polymerase subunit RPC12/RpoP
MLHYETNVNNRYNEYKISLCTEDFNEFLKIFNFINEMLEKQAGVDELYSDKETAVDLQEGDNRPPYEHIIINGVSYPLGDERIEYECPNCFNQYIFELNDVLDKGEITCECGHKITWEKV